MGLGTIYTWSLFNQPLVSKYGWSLNAVAITFSITSLSLAFSTLFASKLQEKWGLRKLIMIAGLALGLGLVLSSQASSLILLYVLAGVVVGYADGTAYITSLSNLIKWFPERKGLISGISVAAYGTGSNFQIYKCKVNRFSWCIASVYILGFNCYSYDCPWSLFNPSSC